MPHLRFTLFLFLLGLLPAQAQVNDTLIQTDAEYAVIMDYDLSLIHI